MDARQFRELVIRPTLDAVDMGGDAACNLLTGTAIHESANFQYVKQGWKTLSDGRGVARSFYGIEPDTAADLCRRYQQGKQLAQAKTAKALWPWLTYPPVLPKLTKVNIEHLLLFDLRFATMVCRLKYWFAPSPLPAADDIEGMADYWGRFYQSKSEPKAMASWVAAYREHRL